MISTDAIKSIIVTIEMVELVDFTNLAEVILYFLSTVSISVWNKYGTLYGLIDIIVSIDDYKNNEVDQCHQLDRGYTLFLVDSFNSVWNKYGTLYGLIDIIVSINN